jgi:hypothetical protein
MTISEEMEPIELDEARAALKLLLAEGKSLWKSHGDDIGELYHWLNLSHTALEPLPVHQERFRLLCEGRSRLADEKLSAAIHMLDVALKTMDACDEERLGSSSFAYRRLISSLPD